MSGSEGCPWCHGTSVAGMSLSRTRLLWKVHTYELRLHGHGSVDHVAINSQSMGGSPQRPLHTRSVGGVHTYELRSLGSCTCDHGGCDWLSTDRAGDNSTWLIRPRTENPTCAPFNLMAGSEAVSMVSWDASGREEPDSNLFVKKSSYV